MSRELSLRNRQRLRVVNTPLLRRVGRWLLIECLGLDAFDLSIQLVEDTTMARLNQQFLQHHGSTDVITFDYAESGARNLHGEIVICLADAVAQAREFQTTWQSELARYLVHGVLHLRGYDDLSPATRRKMKREENRLVREASQCFPLSELEKTIARPKRFTAGARARR